jgi:glycosyltransferase involved in cell wall biosynthesis
VLDALTLLRERGAEAPRLVVAGARKPDIEAHVEGPDRAGIRDLVEFRHSPSQTDLVRLYKAALATVVPSRMEGWGLPAGESLWFGTPAICSTAPALREVAGDLGLYFDPDDAGALADHVDRLMRDDDFAAAHRRRIAAARPGLRTWQDVARDLLAVA